MTQDEQTQISAVLVEQAVQSEKIDKIEDACETIKECLLGSGDPGGSPGLILRTDRLEQRDQLKGKFFWLLFSTVGALVLSVVSLALKIIADAMGISF